MYKKLLSLITVIFLNMTYGMTANAVTFTPFITSADINTLLGQNDTIGFVYAGNKFVGSVYTGGANNNQLYQTDLSGKNIAKFGTPIPNNSGEIALSSSLGLGGFGYRDIFASQQNGVYRISNDGSAGATFVTGLNGTVRGIAFDPYGRYGYNMLVTTDAGAIYRVNRTGQATLIASLGVDTEGLDFVPQTFGIYPKGTLIVASEGNGRLTAVFADGHTSDLGVQIDGAVETFAFIPPTLSKTNNPLEGFYTARFPTDVQHANASDFVPYIGDAIATTETTHTLVRIHWNGANFEVTQLGLLDGQPEDGIFVSSDVKQCIKEHEKSFRHEKEHEKSSHHEKEHEKSHR